MAQSRPSTPVGIWGTDRDEANQTVLSSSAPAGTGIRRTTPIYQNYSQAHTSITGGMPNSRLMSEDPGTDNLNDVYARALEADNAYGVADNEALSGWVTDTQRGQENVNPILPSVSFPFQRPGSPESIEQVQSTDFTDDNPADLALGSDDVALRVRDVRRGSATPQSSHAPLPQAAAYESVQDMGPRRGTVHFDVQDRLEHAHLSPARSPTPYPAAASISPDDESQLESTISAIVEHYQTYHETHGSAGTPPEISLPPAPPSTPVLQSQGMFAVPSVPQNGYYLSSSPPTLSTGLLLNGAGTGAHQHESTLPLAVPPNGQNQLNLDNLEAGRQYAVTVVATRHGNGGTSADPPTTMPVGLQDRSERSRVGGPVREPAVSSQASLGSGAGVESSLLEIRDALRNRMSTATATSDWATTQGSNTQRNSIVPDGELPVFSSSSGVDLASTWDPLSMRNRQVQELNREASELRQAAGLLGNEAANSDGSQGSERYSSPQPAAQFATNGASRGRPLNTQHITSYLSTDSSQAINGAVVPYGSPLRFVRNYFTPSETLVEMSSNTDRRSQDGNVSGSGNSNSGSPSRNNRTDTVTTWREDTAERSRADVLADIARYDPVERPMRHFPNARLTTDRRILEAERDPIFVQRQRQLTRFLIIASVVLYPVGGFKILHSMSENGKQARNALLLASQRSGPLVVGVVGGGGNLTVINNVHCDDMVVATRWLCLGGALWVAVVAVVVAFLCVRESYR